MIVASHLSGEGHFTSAVHKVLPLECAGQFDYWRGILKVWETGEAFINVEHDMECSDTLAEALLDCPHPLCTHAYQLHWPSTGKPDPVYAHRSAPAHQLGQYVDERVEWVDFTGIGFCKITPGDPLRAYGGDAESSWQHVDTSVNAAVTGRWHLHWPAVEHYHH